MAAKSFREERFRERERECWGGLQADKGAAGLRLYLAGSPKGRPEPGFREGAQGHILTRGDRKPAWCLRDSRQADCTDLLSSQQPPGSQARAGTASDSPHFLVIWGSRARPHKPMEPAGLLHCLTPGLRGRQGCSDRGRAGGALGSPRMSWEVVPSDLGKGGSARAPQLDPLWPSSSCGYLGLQRSLLKCTEPTPRAAWGCFSSHPLSLSV